MGKAGTGSILVSLLISGRIHPMNRRTFLTLASATPVGLTCTAAGHEPDEWEMKEAAARQEWSQFEERTDSGVFKSLDGNLRLEVALIHENDKVVEETITTHEGEETVYRFEGELLPRWLRPSDGIIKRFRFFWDDREIPVAKRFWNDFGGCHITRCTIDRKTIPKDMGIPFDAYLAELRGPKVSLSADGGTALIEWVITDTGACCGHTATVRWMISKSGHVMRHRHTTPSGC